MWLYMNYEVNTTLLNSTIFSTNNTMYDCRTFFNQIILNMCYLSSVEIDHMLLVIFCADDLHAAIDVFRE